jgi:hypothetical protein
MLRGFSACLIDTSGLSSSKASSESLVMLADMTFAIVTWPGSCAIVSVLDELHQYHSPDTTLR